MAQDKKSIVAKSDALEETKEKAETKKLKKRDLKSRRKSEPIQSIIKEKPETLTKEKVPTTHAEINIQFSVEPKGPKSKKLIKEKKKQEIQDKQSKVSTKSKRPKNV